MEDRTSLSELQTDHSIPSEVPGGPAHRTSPSPHATYRVRVRISVICPFYNEVENASRSATEVVEFATANPDFHFLFVDDGSTDGTASALAGRLEASGTSGVELLSLGTNGGKGRALRSALPRCLGDCVCFLDGDLPYSLDHLHVLDRGLADNHVVIGSRVLAEGHGGTLARRFYGAGFNWLVRTSLGLPFRDTQAGLKGLRRDVAEHLFGLQRIDGFGFDAELLYLARKFGYRVAEVPARLSPSHAYTASARRLVVDASKMLREVTQIRRNDARGLYR